MTFPVSKIGATYFPPQAGINSRSSAQNTSCHLVGICTGDAGRVNPDLVAKTRNIEAGQVRGLKPLGLHGALPSSSGGRSLFDQQHTFSGLAELVRNGNATSTGTNDDVVVRLAWGRCANGNGLRCRGWLGWRLGSSGCWVGYPVSAHISSHV